MDKKYMWVGLTISHLLCLAIPTVIATIIILAMVMQGGGGGGGAVTTVILSRHGEKTSDTELDPPLSTAGQTRAQTLAKMCRNAGIKTIYVTQFRRTQDTAAPTAQEFGITPIAINEPEKIAEDILSHHQGETILVVGHTNTLPQVIEGLGGVHMEKIPEEDYENLFVVTKTGNQVVTLNLRYGL